jgi:hypothetical protein
MHAHREARGDPRELHRAGQEGAPAAAARLRRSSCRARRCRRTTGLVRAPGVHELGGQHTTGAFVPGHGFAVGGQRLVDQVEGVSLAQFAVEIDVGRRRSRPVGWRHCPAGRLRRSQQTGNCECCRWPAAPECHRARPASRRSIGQPADAGQAREMGAGLVALGGRKTSHQFLQAAIGRGLGLHHLAAAAGQHRAGDAVVRSICTAAGSRTPNLASRASAVSMLRVMSLRVSDRSCADRASSWASKPWGTTASTTKRCASGVESLAKGATATAVMPKPAINATAPAIRLLRWWPTNCCRRCAARSIESARRQ